MNETVNQLNLSQVKSEFRNFSFVQKLKVPPEEIRLLTKIYNRDSRGKDFLSVVYVNRVGNVYGFGHNGHGCLGLSSVQLIHNKPSGIKSLSNNKSLTKLCSGNCFVVALTEDGKCYSWGDNKFGQLGLGKSLVSVNRPTLIEITKKEPVRDVCCGLNHVLMTTEWHNLYSFGSNVTGAIGNGTTFHQTKPFKLTNLAESTIVMTDVFMVAAGGWHSACLNQKGELFVWGWNQDGQCGNDDLRTNELVPKLVLINNDNENFACPYLPISSVQCGLHHTLVLTYDGSVFAFGGNEFGECGLDPAKVKICSKAEQIYFDENIVQIGAIAKSRISLARSESHFYVWGESIGSTESGQFHLPRKIGTSQQIQLNYLFNNILSKYEKSQYSYDHLQCETNDQSTNRMLIVNGRLNQHRGVKSGNLNLTFNQANDSDMVFVIQDDNLLKQPLNILETNSKPPPMMIFVQRFVLESYSTFIKNCFKIVSSSSAGDDEDAKMEVDQNPVDQDQTVDQRGGDQLVDNLSDNSMSTSTVITVGRNKRKFIKICVDGQHVDYETLYAYLFFIYSGYFILDERKLIDLIQLSHLIPNPSLLEACLHYIRNKFSVDQLCSLYSFAIKSELAQVAEVCFEQVQSLLTVNSQSATQITTKLYNERRFADLTICCTEPGGPDGSPIERRLTLHRLILHCSSQFYRMPIDDGANPANIARQLFEMNQVTSAEQLLKLDTIHFGKLVSLLTLETYVHYVYHHQERRVLADTSPVLIDLFKLAKVFNEQKLEQICLSRLRQKISFENVCQFFCQFGLSEENRFVADMCSQFACADLKRLMICDDFRRLLADKDHTNLQQFMLFISNYCKKSTSTSTI